MKKLISIRPRAADPNQPIPIYMDEELPELQDYSTVNRALPKMPSGMQEDEECEHHLQKAINKGAIIPTPPVIATTDVQCYNEIYTENFKMPSQLIRIQPFLMDQEEFPDYDMDSEDEQWVESQMDVTPTQFEEVIDRLEKTYNPNTFTFDANKAYLKEEDDVSRRVFEYWLNKRNKTQRPLMPTVKTEKVDRGSKTVDPYVVFRRHAYEKIRTRKIRKNDETCYEKILSVRNNLNKVKVLLDWIKDRENLKKENVKLTMDIYEKRYEAEDFDGAMLAEAISKNPRRPIPPPIVKHQIASYLQNKERENHHIFRNEIKHTKKRKLKASVGTRMILDPRVNNRFNSESDSQLLQSSAASSSDCNDSGGEEEFGFHRNNYSTYLPPVSNGLGNWPWCDKSEGGLADKKYKFALTSINKPKPRCIGLARRRVGRGGRVILDRYSNDDDLWSSLDFTVFESKHETPASSSTNNDFLHFRPEYHPALEDSSSENYSSDSEIEETEEFPEYPFPTQDESIFIDIQSEGLMDEPMTFEFNASDYFSVESITDYGSNPLES